MELGSLLILLLVLACPLMMVWMMRGGHGHGAHGAGHMHGHAGATDTHGSLEELRRRRAELDAEISQRESDDAEATAPAATQGSAGARR